MELAPEAHAEMLAKQLAYEELRTKAEAEAEAEKEISTFLLTRDLHPGRSSSIRKLTRAERIRKGLRTWSPTGKVRLLVTQATTDYRPKVRPRHFGDEHGVRHAGDRSKYTPRVEEEKHARYRQVV